MRTTAGDRLVYRNDTTTPTFVIVSLRSTYDIRSVEFGFYLDTGPAPAEPVASAGNLNPFTALAGEDQRFPDVGGVTHNVSLSNTGALLEVRVQNRKTPWMAGGTGAGATASVIDANGVPVCDYRDAECERSVTGPLFGIDANEIVFSIPVDPARPPTAVRITTSHARARAPCR